MINVALIGLGKMGISHLAIVRSHPLVRLVAVCDTTKYVLDILSKYAGLKTYSDYKTLLANEKLDAVVVATPSRYHGQIVRAALDRGIHVFCEKPFCLDLEEGRELAELAKAKGLVNQVGYHYRFVGAFQEVRRLLEANTISKVHHIRAEAYGPVVLRPKGKTWRSSKSEGGGCLFDYASHALDLMNFLVGPPTEVRGSILNSVFSVDVDDEVYSTLTFENGITGQLAANWSDESFRKMSMKISIWGDGGRIIADRQEVQIYYRGGEGERFGLKSGWNVRYTTEVTEDVWFYLRGEEYSAQIDHFVRMIGERSMKNVSSFASAIDTDRAIESIITDASNKNTQSMSAKMPGSTTGLRKRRSMLGSLFSAK